MKTVKLGVGNINGVVQWIVINQVMAPYLAALTVRSIFNLFMLLVVLYSFSQVKFLFS